MVRSDPKHGVYVEGRQLATDAVSTVTDQLNNDEEPSIDISEIVHLVKTAGHPRLEVVPDASHDTTQSTSGSGTVGQSGGADVQTGSTSGSHARVRGNVNSEGLHATDFDSSFWAVLSVSYISPGGIHYAGWGEPTEGDFTPKHVGVKLDGTTLEGSVADGTTESTVELDTGVSSNDNYTIIIEFNAGTEVNFYLTTFSSTPDGTVSANLPSGSGPLRRYVLHVENSSTNNRRSILTEYAKVMVP